jgi:hypothetical protein
MSSSSAGASPTPCARTSTPARAAILAPFNVTVWGENLDAGTMGVFYDRGESCEIHRRQILAGSVAPAIGEGLDDIGLVDEGLLHRGMCLCRCADELREVIAPTELGPVALRRTKADCELHPRLDKNAAALERTERSQHLAIHAVIVDGGNSADEVGLQAFAEVIYGVGCRCIEMGCADRRALA